MLAQPQATHFALFRTLPIVGRAGPAQATSRLPTPARMLGKLNSVFEAIRATIIARPHPTVHVIIEAFPPPSDYSPPPSKKGWGRSSCFAR